MFLDSRADRIHPQRDSPGRLCQDGRRAIRATGTGRPGLAKRRAVGVSLQADRGARRHCLRRALCELSRGAAEPLGGVYHRVPGVVAGRGKSGRATPAFAAGLHKGDRIVSINGHPVQAWEEMAKTILASPGRPLDMDIQRDGTTHTVSVVPTPIRVPDLFNRSKTVGRIGAWSSGEARVRRVGPVVAFQEAIRRQGAFTAQTLMGLLLVITGRVSMRDSMTGPIGIVYMTSEAMRSGLPALLMTMSLLSLSLAIFNVFPIPILDGGHLFFLAMEKLRGRPVSLHIQERSAQVSFVLLVTLVLVICINDVNRFGLVEKLFGWAR